mmetsp:Transcript_32133/g.81868  ORF Transcript_32133/g.81868 Transcript_32133/m.81868 type:complete len:233 (-) Transcript_32133:2051-2749(-)
MRTASRSRGAHRLPPSASSSTFSACRSSLRPTPQHPSPEGCSTRCGSPSRWTSRKGTPTGTASLRPTSGATPRPTSSRGTLCRSSATTALWTSPTPRCPSPLPLWTPTRSTSGSTGRSAAASTCTSQASPRSVMPSTSSRASRFHPRPGQPCPLSPSGAATCPSAPASTSPPLSPPKMCSTGAPSRALAGAPGRCSRCPAARRSTRSTTSPIRTRCSRAWRPRRAPLAVATR